LAKYVPRHLRDDEESQDALLWSVDDIGDVDDLGYADTAEDDDVITKPKLKPRVRSARFRISLALGIVFIVIALVIAVFLAYKYLSAGQQANRMQQAAGMDLGASEVPFDTDLDALDINWEALRGINPDIVGWVVIPGTRINYPIVQASDNEFYLHHLFDKTYSDAGAIFLDGENDPAITGENNIIYGHNLLDGSMFAGLKAYREQGFFDEHRTILLATPEANYRLEVDAALVCDADDKIRRFGFSDRADFEGYAEMLLDYAVINTLPVGEIPEKLYCFATCTDNDYSKRMVVLASVVETTASEASEEKPEAPAEASEATAPAASTPDTFRGGASA
jgi:sortase B